MLKIQWKPAKGNRYNKMLIAGTVLLIILAAAACYLSISILGNPRVYSGVYLDGVNMAGLNEEDLTKFLEKKYETDISSMELNIFHRSYPVQVSFDEFSVRVNHQSIHNNIYSPGRKGNVFSRLMEIYQLHTNRLFLETDVYMDTNAIDRLIADIDDKTYTAAVAPTLLVLDDGVYLHSGTCGYAVNREKLKKQIIDQINTLQSGIVIVPVGKNLPARVDIDALYSQIIQEPRDASVNIAGNEITIIPEIVGRTIDRAEFLSWIAEMEAKSAKYPLEMKLPVTFVKPEKTSKIIEEALFRDELAAYSTTFPLKTEMDKNRAVNIRLAVEAINDTLMMPGDTFSFNGVVGERTQEKGYQSANIYGATGIESGIGGGICQVSSTLYNAALKANLKIDERNPHIYQVAYVPLGRDAAVSYGIEDFRFTNNTAWPVKIKGQVSGDEIHFTLNGTNEDPDLEVVIQPSVLKTIPYTTEYVEDRSLAAGSSTIRQAGMNGAIVDTFFSVRAGKNILTSYKLHTTTYKALPAIIHVSGK